MPESYSVKWYHRTWQDNLIFLKSHQNCWMMTKKLKSQKWRVQNHELLVVLPIMPLRTKAADEIGEVN